MSASAGGLCRTIPGIRPWIPTSWTGCGSWSPLPARPGIWTIRKPDIWREGLIARWNGREAVLLPGEAKTLAWGLSFLHRQMKKPKEEPAVYASFPVVVVSEPWRRIPADANRGEKKEK